MELYVAAQDKWEVIFAATLRVIDDAGNESDMSNEWSVTTDQGSWSIEVLDEGGRITSLAYEPTDPTGGTTISLTDDDFEVCDFP